MDEEKEGLFLLASKVVIFFIIYGGRVVSGPHPDDPGPRSPEPADGRRDGGAVEQRRIAIGPHVHRERDHIDQLGKMASHDRSPGICPLTSPIGIRANLKIVNPTENLLVTANSHLYGCSFFH